MIYFDNIVFSLQKSGGISVVWYEFLSRYLDRHHPNEYRMIENSQAAHNMFRQLLAVPDSVRVKEQPLVHAVNRYRDVSVTSPDDFIFHSSYYRVCRSPRACNITTVHDFTYEYYCRGWRKTIHCWQKHRAIRQSDWVICISQNTKKDLIRFIPDYPADQIQVIHNGVSDTYKILDKEPQKSCVPYPQESFVLYVGARDAYKNFDLAVQAVAETTLNLVIVGPPLSADELRLLKHHLGTGRYEYAGRISNEALNELYNSAYALLYPSSYEGFGMPVLEAQRAGCPVIAYRASSIQEIIGEGRLLMDQLTSREICQKLNLLKSRALRMAVIEEGLNNAKKYSWEKMYDGIQNLYHEAANR